MGFIIDTCIWIDVEQGALAPVDVASLTGDAPVFLSPVTLAELKFGAEIAGNPSIRQKRLAALLRLQRKPLRLSMVIRRHLWRPCSVHKSLRTRSSLSGSGFVARQSGNPLRVSPAYTK